MLQFIWGEKVINAANSDCDVAVMHPYSASAYTACVMTQLTEGLDWVITHSVPFALFVGSNVHI